MEKRAPAWHFSPRDYLASFESKQYVYLDAWNWQTLQHLYYNI